MTVSLWRASVAALLGFVGIATASAAAPEAKDLGPVADHAGDQGISVTIALKLEDLAGAEAMMQRVSTPGSPLYQQFLTPERFAAQFGPSEATVSKVVTQLRNRGLNVERMTATTLKATGTPAAIEQAFQTSLHQFELPATDKAPASTYSTVTSPTTPSNSPALPPNLCVDTEN